MTNVVLRTLCGCERTIVADLRSMHVRVALLPPIPVVEMLPPEKGAAAVQTRYREFRYTGNHTRDGTPIMMEVE
jgi:hypothetical protein